MKKIFLTLLILCIASIAFAQEQVHVAGYVTQMSKNKPIVNAVVYQENVPFDDFGIYGLIGVSDANGYWHGDAWVVPDNQILISIKAQGFNTVYFYCTCTTSIPWCMCQDVRMKKTK